MPAADVPRLTTAAVAARSAAAQARQLEYDQDAVDAHGQSDGEWRADCSGLICAIAGLPTGLDCPSTAELTASYVEGPVTRFQAVPYRTVTMTTADDGTGHEFGHVALVVDFDQASNRLRIQEHGGGVGPDDRWLPAGMAYDSMARYGSYRPFKLYNLTHVSDQPEDNVSDALDYLKSKAYLDAVATAVHRRLLDNTGSSLQGTVLRTSQDTAKLVKDESKD